MDKTNADALASALTLMLKTFDHCGLRGLTLSKTAKRNGWPPSFAQHMSDVCDVAKKTLLESGYQIEGIVRS